MIRELVLEFEGYWTEASERFLPEKSGVYCVYRGIHDAGTRKVVLKELIYIGESENVRRRVSTHERKPFWREHLKNDEVLCYSFTPIQIDRNRAKAALIYEHKPPENLEFIYEFPYSDTAVFITGKAQKLSPYFAALETADYFSSRSNIC